MVVLERQGEAGLLELGDWDWVGFVVGNSAVFLAAAWWRLRTCTMVGVIRASLRVHGEWWGWGAVVGRAGGKLEWVHTYHS